MIQGVYSRFQVIGRDDQMGAKIKTPKNLCGFQQNPGKSLDKKLTFEKTHAESLKT